MHWDPPRHVAGRPQLFPLPPAVAALPAHLVSLSAPYGAGVLSGSGDFSASASLPCSGFLTSRLRPGGKDVTSGRIVGETGGGRTSACVISYLMLFVRVSRGRRVGSRVTCAGWLRSGPYPAPCLRLLWEGERVFWVGLPLRNGDEYSILGWAGYHGLSKPGSRRAVSNVTVVLSPSASLLTWIENKRN